LLFVAHISIFSARVSDYQSQSSILGVTKKILIFTGVNKKIFFLGFADVINLSLKEPFGKNRALRRSALNPIRRVIFVNLNINFILLRQSHLNFNTV